MTQQPSGLHFFQRGWLSSNNVLLVDDQTSILIDTGYHSHATQTLALVNQTLQGQPLSRILNTHLHSDHCGGNALLQQAHPTAHTSVPPGLSASVMVWDTHQLSFDPTGQTCPRFRLDSVIHPLDHFDIAGFTWTAHAAPGHDPHSLIFFEEQSRILVSADALWQNGFGVVFPEIEGEAAFDEVESSLNLIEQLQPQQVLPGHGSAFTDVGDALGRARQRLQGFKKDPKKHALYASKVLLKFKLLEFQKIEYDAFVKWVNHTAYFEILRTTYWSHQSALAWLHDILNDLQKSGALQREGDYLVNVTP